MIFLVPETNQDRSSRLYVTIRRTPSGPSILSEPVSAKRANIGVHCMLRMTKPRRTLTRVALREVVYASCPKLSRAEAQKIVEATIEEICEALARGEAVKLHSFGVFNIRAKCERSGRNPRTGVEALIPSRKVVRFKASPVLVAHMNGYPVNNLDD
jgi:integration host factor subunit alpha